MRMYFVIALIYLSTYSDAQIQKEGYRQVDRLINILPTLSGKTRIDSLNTLSKTYTWLQADSAKLLALQALHEAQTHNYTNGIINAYYNLAWLNWHTAKNYPEMESYCRKAILLMEQTGRTTQLAEFYFSLAIPLSAQGNFMLAIEALVKARQLYSEAGNEHEVGNMYAYIAYVEQLRGHYGNSLQYSAKYLDIAEQHNDIRHLDIWGELYKFIGDYETALDYYRQAIAKAKAAQKIDDLIFHTRAAGEVFFLQHKYDSALHYYNRLIALFPARDMPTPFLGEYFLVLKKYKQAQQHLLYALNYYRKANGVNEIMWTLLRLSRLYKETSNNKKATNCATELLQLAYQTGAQQYKRDGHQLLYQLYLSAKSPQNAFYHLQKYTAIKDTLDKDLSAQQLAIYKIGAEKEKAQNHIDLLNKEKILQQQIIKQTSQQRNFLIMGITALVLFGFIVFRNVKLKRKHEKMRLENLLEIEKLESEKRQAELQHQASEMKMMALRAQMNPHFIFNSLNSINRFILKNESQIASDYLTKFSRLIRMVLDYSREPEISLRDELQYLELYIQMEQLRLKNAFHYNFNIADNVDIDTIRIPSLLLQPFIENAIWHGLMHKTTGGKLSINITADGSTLCCTIEDNGIGRKKAEVLKTAADVNRKSAGMQITMSRLEILNAEHKTNVNFNILDMEDNNPDQTGTKVVISLPIS